MRPPVVTTGLRGAQPLCAEFDFKQRRIALRSRTPGKPFMPEATARGLLSAQGLITLEGLLRIMRAAGDAYGHDYEAILIYWSIVLASVGRYMRADDLIVLIESGGPLPEAEHHPVSARAIAEATGLPRETVRRKIAHLVAAGHLVLGDPLTPAFAAAVALVAGGLILVNRAR